MTEWAEEYGNSQELIRDRLKRGWNAEDAVIVPPRSYRSMKSAETPTDGQP